jgi:hypothetical protein
VSGVTQGAPLAANPLILAGFLSAPLPLPVIVVADSLSLAAWTPPSRPVRIVATGVLLWVGLQNRDFQASQKREDGLSRDQSS